MKKAKEICSTTTMESVKKGALLIDVRRKNEVEKVSFDVENYINIPLDELENRMNEIPKEQEIIMVCHSGERSLRTTYFLMNAGFENVSNLSGGIMEWAAKKFPTKGDVDFLLNSGNCDCSEPNCC